MSSPGWSDIALSDFTSVGTIDFQTGDNGAGPDPAAGDEITQSSPGGTQTGLIIKIDVDTGSWDTSDAVGTIYYIKTNTDAQDFVHTGSNIAVTGKSVTLDPTAVVTGGAVDLRAPHAQYICVVPYTPTTVTPSFLLYMHLFALVDNSSSEQYGFPMAASDELMIPIDLNHGRRTVEADRGGFFGYAMWDNSAGVLNIIVGFQGLRGLGDDASRIVPACILSLDAESTGRCGDLLDLDLDDLSGFRMTFDTNDTGGGGSTPPGNPTPGGGYEIIHT